MSDYDIIKEALDQYGGYGSGPLYEQALEALDRLQEWQPIETAPKDGAVIMAIRNEEGFSGIPNFISWDEDDWRHYQKIAYVKHQPTHWQPLPASPQEV